MMREESTTPDLVQRVRLLIEAMNRRDFDAFESFFTPDAVWRGREIGTFEGAAAVRGFVEDMVSPYEEWEMESEEILDLGCCKAAHMGARRTPCFRSPRVFVPNPPGDPESADSRTCGVLSGAAPGSGRNAQPAMRLNGALNSSWLIGCIDSAIVNPLERLAPRSSSSGCSRA
jgi:hypothetical protein